MLTSLRNRTLHSRRARRLLNGAAQNVEYLANAAMGTVEKDLIAIVIALMRPIIMAHIPSAQGSVHNASAAVTNGPEGKALVAALKGFIGANVLAVLQQESGSTGGTSKGAQENTDTKSVSALAPCVEVDPDILSWEEMFERPARLSMQDTNRAKALVHYVNPAGRTSNATVETQSSAELDIPPGVPPTELEAMTLKLTRAHVFNNMPIRLVSFDTTGHNLQLIERDEIFRRLLPSVRAETTTPEFEREWRDALALHDIHYAFRARLDRMSELVTAAIGRGAHYAILSHTWIRGAPGDVVFSTWPTRTANPQGHAKIANFCRVAAREHGLRLGWLDTVCINKDSSSELDESIRSMYRWYRGARVCITYLAETERVGEGTHDSWFARGWTLQELLAPTNLVFYNKEWRRLGSTRDNNIQSWIEAETTVTKQELELCRKGMAEDIPLSRRMQMASRRQVTREEDASYSLLGLLDVDISVAYGEGAARAFHRLFRELLATKKHVLDLFNRTYFEGDSLIPPSLTRYSGRQSWFDNANGGTRLDNHLLAEPIAVTHLGVRIQCLLIPSLCSESEEEAEYEPKGQFSLRMETSLTLQSGNQRVYDNILDRRLYLPGLPALPIMDVLPTNTVLQTFAVINIAIKDDMVILPAWCMSIVVYTPDKPGKLNTTRSTMTIPISELESHGMQLVTLYL